ncbi:MAG: threonine synthase [Armatimonadetes bacterium]|nr:threonine synthase [Armatimonadota bacterium]
MQYVSTRGGTVPASFGQAVMMGLAEDGGLLVPDRIPRFHNELPRLSRLSYPQLALELMSPFVDDVPREDLEELLERSYGPAFGEPVARLVELGAVSVLELFHGPTLAFKDVALQFLGNLFEYLLGRENQHLNVLVATSGDTGSAAIYGLRGRERINVFVMHPRGRISGLQERQMTTVLDGNVFNLAIEGSFDDCQQILKALSANLEFKRRVGLGAVNSVNWARVLAQLVYYFWAYLRSGAERIQFSVPTGNFGNILAGWYAWRMGLPIERLVLGTNDNDILARFYQTGVYARGSVRHTLAPAMDIQVASNFERYLYHRLDGDPQALRRAMDTFRAAGELRLGQADPIFRAAACDRRQILSTIRRFHEEHGYLLDPHTAVGVAAGLENALPEIPLVCVGTAHPAKFPRAIQEAIGKDLARHPRLDVLADLPTRLEVLDNDPRAVARFIEIAVGLPAGA